MNIHNTMEDVISKEVNKLYDQLKRDHITWLNCDCENCRLDTICYVLNRTTPKYTVSERGTLHNVLDIDDDSQLRVDVTSIALEGIRLINGSQRSYHKNLNLLKQSAVDGEMFYNFPMIIGAVYDGNTFEPLSNASITLKDDDNILEMYDTTWENPAKTYKSTQGTYSFWPKSISCKAASEPKVFMLTFEISADGYEPTTYAVTLPIVPENETKTTLDSSYSLKIKDIFLFNKGTTNPMD